MHLLLQQAPTARSVGSSRPLAYVGGGSSEASSQVARKWVGGCRGIAGRQQTERRRALLLAGMGTVGPKVIPVGISVNARVPASTQSDGQYQEVQAGSLVGVWNLLSQKLRRVVLLDCGREGQRRHPRSVRSKGKERAAIMKIVRRATIIARRCSQVCWGMSGS